MPIVTELTRKLGIRGKLTQLTQPAACLALMASPLALALPRRGLFSEHS